MDGVTSATYDTNFPAWKAKIDSLKLQKERLRDDYLSKMRSLYSGLPINPGQPASTQAVVDAAWALFDAKQTEIDTLYPDAGAAAPGGGGGH
jgi:hypothetical protein